MLKKLQYIRFTLICSLCFLLLTSFQNQYNTNAKIKSLFIYNFAKYIEWPNTYKKGNFIVGILGDHPVYDELQKMAQLKKVFDQKLEIVKFSSIDEIKKCHMLMVTSKMESKVNEASNKIKPYHTLLITEKEGLGKSSDINFVVVGNKQKFELNKPNLTKRNLKVSNNLLSLAIVIE